MTATKSPVFSSYKNKLQHFSHHMYEDQTLFFFTITSMQSYWTTVNSVYSKLTLLHCFYFSNCRPPAGNLVAVVFKGLLLTLLLVLLVLLMLLIYWCIISIVLLALLLHF